MKVTYNSRDPKVKVSVPAAGTVVGCTSTSNSKMRAYRVAVSVLSTADHVALSIKPSVLAQEERQRRLSRTIRLGFPPLSMSTKG